MENASKRHCCFPDVYSCNSDVSTPNLDIFPLLVVLQSRPVGVLIWGYVNASVFGAFQRRRRCCPVEGRGAAPCAVGVGREGKQGFHVRPTRRSLIDVHGSKVLLENLDPT